MCRLRQDDLAAAALIDVMKYIFHLVTGIILGLNINHPASALALGSVEAPGLESLHIQFSFRLSIQHIAFFICPWPDEDGKDAAGNPHWNRDYEDGIYYAALAHAGRT